MCASARKIASGSTPVRGPAANQGLGGGAGLRAVHSPRPGASRTRRALVRARLARQHSAVRLDPRGAQQPHAASRPAEHAARQACSPLRRRSHRPFARTRKLPRRAAAWTPAPGAMRPESSRSARLRASRTPRRRRPATLPLHVGDACPRVGEAREHEQQVRQAVHVASRSGSTAPSPSETMWRSARRQMVRATCSAAPAGAPPGRMKRRAARAPPRPRRSRPPAGARLRRRAPPFARARRCAPSGRRAGRRARTGRAAAARAAGRGPRRRRCARASPSIAFSSSTCPYASTRGSDLRTRVPSKSAVSPASPVRV